MPYKLKSICSENPLYVAGVLHLRAAAEGQEQAGYGSLTCLKLQQERDMGLVWLEGSVHDCTALHNTQIQIYICLRALPQVCEYVN